MQEPIPYSTKTPPAPIVSCSHCGAAIHRDQAAPIVAQAQVGEIVDMSRRWRCRDRERCDARGPVAQTVEQLRADLDAAEVVITELKSKVENLRQERDGLDEELAAERAAHRQTAIDLSAGREYRPARLNLRDEWAEARRFEREHTDCDDPECPRHGYGEEE